MFSEQDVDRELKAALTVSPSPDFEARVLRRIQVGRGAETLVPRGEGLYLAVAASTVLAAGLFYALNRTPVVVVAPRATPPGVARTEPRPAVPPPLAEPTTQPMERRHVARVRPAAAARRAEPEVILPVHQMEAVRRLADAVDEGRIVLTAAAEGSVDPPVEVVVAPIVVEPLPVPALDPDAGGPSVDIRRLE